jgi:hypothetical protein
MGWVVLLTVNSSPASTIIVKNDATISISTPTPEVCVPNNVIITAAISGGSSALTRMWQSSPVGLNTWSNYIRAKPEQLIQLLDLSLQVWIIVA